MSAPRSGAGLLQETLLLEPTAYKSSLSKKEFFADAVDGVHSQSHVLEILEAELQSGKIAFDYLPFFGSSLEWLRETFPDAKFVYVTRRPIDAIASGIQAWESGRFGYWNELEGWWGQPWSFGLIPNWEQYIGRPLAEIVTEQFLQVSQNIRSQLELVEPKNKLVITFEDLLSNPAETISQVMTFAGGVLSSEVAAELPPSSRSFPKLASIRERMNLSEVYGALGERSDSQQATFEYWNSNRKHVDEELLTEDVAPSKKKIKISTGTAFSSTHSNSLVELLTAASSSIAISTYKSGHLIIASEYEGSINTTYRNFDRPMGIAVSGTKLAVGTRDSIQSFSNQPRLGQVVEPKGFFDTVYAPRNVVYTGDVAIHEMGYGAKEGKDELWFVNTGFSCLCRLDADYSFVPVWTPEWISGLANEDRCHLNGLAMVDGQPKYVTALSQTDTAFGWREKKGTSGVIVDIETNRLITDGLSMPHSPRWYREKLWVLESGKGTLATVDVVSGEVTTVATLPGFTRGLAFIGSYALVGLSQVRESVFKELPVTDSTAERNAGVWMVDIRTGAISGMLRFEGVVTEVFDVAVLPAAKKAIVIEQIPATANAYTLPAAAMAQLAKPRQPEGTLGNSN